MKNAYLEEYFPSEQYHADPCESPSLSSSIIKILCTQSPMHAKLAHPKLNRNFKPQESGTFDLGTAAHAMLFEGGAGIIKIDPREFPAKNGNIPEGWTNDAIRAARDAARAEGKTPVLAKQYEEIERMFSAARVALLRCTDIPGLSLIDEGKKEATIIWQESNGIWCRVRPDCLAHDASIVLDYKTTT
jgi:hypothetical protein